MKYLDESVEKASKHCVEELRRDGGIGGVIALDNRGHSKKSPCLECGVRIDNAPIVAMPLNCSGMYRGVIREDGRPKTAIFDDDELD